MSTTAQRRLAEQFYHSGRALYDHGRYAEAIGELQRAENAFREIDLPGHPFSKPLPNGISGLANALSLTGRCFQQLSQYDAAITYYETCLVNAKFEKKKPFRRFMEKLADDLSVCYEHIIEKISDPEREALTSRDPEIDISFRFPYSLPADAVPLARLYELAPGRHAVLRDFYERARQKDTLLRRKTSGTDESGMKKLSIYVWGIIAAVWVVYALIVIEALNRH